MLDSNDILQIINEYGELTLVQRRCPDCIFTKARLQQLEETMHSPEFKALVRVDADDIIQMFRDNLQ
ncbi:MAG: hypothetical protein IJZ95_07095 [Oscillospiraceae bacterium]|nr:hypothetical protein [Oscillospiraceae bacterium]